MFYTNTDLLIKKIKIADLSYAKIAQYLEVDPPKVSLICNNKAYPRPSEIFILAKILKLTDKEICEIFFRDLNNEDDGVKCK